jgi:sarcosine oxidase gamma subunit
VPELQQISAGVLGCFARPDALDRLAVPTAIPLRTAPDELLLVGVEGAPELERELAAIDPDCLVLDLSGGFTICVIRGDGRHEAFARLSALPPPPPGTFAQGLFAQTPAKIIARSSDYLVLVSAAVGRHLHSRLLASCHELAPTKLPPGPLTPPAAAGRPA